MTRIRKILLLLIITQGLHSIEEYIGRLWESFPPARFVSGLVSTDLEKGFIIANVGLFIFGILCLLITTSASHVRGRGLIWFWIVIETINGIGHPIWSLYEKKYTPGLVTAPILLVLALYLAKLISARPYTKQD